MSVNFPHTVSSLPMSIAIFASCFSKANRNPHADYFKINIAPAATAVEYEAVKFNVTTKGNPFVGTGPEVDRAWRDISYDSKSSCYTFEGEAIILTIG